jgi:hypothetical protein
MNALSFTLLALSSKRIFTNFSSRSCKSEIERKSACVGPSNLYVYIVKVIDARLNGPITKSFEKLTMKPNQNHLAESGHGQLKSKFHEKTKSYEV